MLNLVLHISAKIYHISHVIIIFRKFSTALCLPFDTDLHFPNSWECISLNLLQILQYISFLAELLVELYNLNYHGNSEEVM